MKRELTSRDWFGKASAGFVLGFLLALGLAGLFKLTAGLGETFFSAQGQFSMWMMSPIWVGVLSFCFLFASGLRAWLWLGLANLLVWGAIAAGGGLAS